MKLIKFWDRDVVIFVGVSVMKLGITMIERQRERQRDKGRDTERDRE